MSQEPNNVSVNPCAMELSHDAIRVVAASLTTTELCVCSFVSRQWKECCAADQIWAKAINRDFGSSALHKSVEPVRARYSVLAETCASLNVPKEFFRRANAIFSRLEDIAIEKDFPGLLCRLRPAASVEDLLTAEEAFRGSNRTIPPALRAILMVHDGHSDNLSFPGDQPDGRPTFLGYYNMYSTLVSAYLLPLELINAVTKANNLDPRYLALTRNLWGAGGHIILDTSTGGVYTACSGARLVRACPPIEGRSDDLLRWLEELVDRIHTGVYSIGALPQDVADAVRHVAKGRGVAKSEEEDDEGSDDETSEMEWATAAGAGDGSKGPAKKKDVLRAVSLFPEPGPRSEGLASHASTSDINIAMGCVFVPHGSYPGPGVSVDATTGLPPVIGPSPSKGRAATAVHMEPAQALLGRYQFGYRCRMSFGPAPSPLGPLQMPQLQDVMRSVQLTSRQWRIEEGTGKVEQVSGPGVVGEHPLLTFGGPPFLYSSASTAVLPNGGRMSGSLTFAPGSMNAPTGDPIDAVVNAWELRVPSYIYG